jgi:hypothetical protein
MREQVLELLPELQEIRDPSLRDKVTAVWAEAMAQGGWRPPELTEIPFTLLAGKIDLRFIEHIRSCAKMCLAVEKVLKEVWGDRVPIDHDTLIAGALLADVGKLLEYDRKDGQVIKGHLGDMLRHPFSGVGLCWKHELPAEVMHIVATHSKEGDHVPRTIESIIFHHVDFVDFDIAKALGK